jgi:thiol-disulfide isomerase/thioredoxin
MRFFFFELFSKYLCISENVLMKKNILLLVSSLLIACSPASKDHAILQGSVQNATSKTITVQNRDYKKEIKINEDGSFQDTLQLVKNVENYIQNFYTLSTENGRMFVYLKNGYNLNLAIDESNFEENLAIKGKGAENSNYILDRIQTSAILESIEPFFKSEKEIFITKVTEIKETFDALVYQHKNIDEALQKGELQSNNELYEGLMMAYEQQNRIAVNTKKGAPSPIFVNYENYKGVTTSLDDFKGKYVYIDVWATWCGPCRQQIPFLNELEEKYHGKNIEFVSISTDSPEQHETWKKMIAEKNMGGIQLFAGKEQSFVRAYEISGIPRFILIDPAGNILDANAPRPSDQSLIALLDTLKL